MYDEETGERVIHRGKPLARPPGLGTPCETCPRKSPEKEAETTMSDQSWKAYSVYLEERAMNFACLTDRQKTDPLFRRVMGIIGVIQHDHEHGQLVEAGQLSARMAMLHR
jgi:hypothetical protein